MPRLLPIAICLVFAMMITGQARADTVVLTNGNRFEGEIQEDSQAQVVIKVRGGLLTFPRRLVKSVTRAPKREAKAGAKPPAGKAGAAPGALDAPELWGRPNLWFDERKNVRVGEVWHFKRQYFQRAWTVTRIGLDAIAWTESEQWSGGAPRKARTRKGYWYRAFFAGQLWKKHKTLAWSRPRYRSRAPKHEAAVLTRVAQGRDVRLQLAGRSFPCKLVEDLPGAPSGAKVWVHFRDGQPRWPGPIKATEGSRVVHELVQIDPPPPGRVRPPQDPGARVGDTLVLEHAGPSPIVERWVVRRMCPTQVEASVTKQPQRRASTAQVRIVWEWKDPKKWTPKRMKTHGYTVGKPRPVRIGSQTVQACDATRPGLMKATERLRYAVDSAGRRCFPGVLLLAFEKPGEPKPPLSRLVDWQRR